MTTKPKDLFLLEGISQLCFNKDYTQCVLSKKNHLAYIYDVPNIKDTSTWTLKDTLDAHVLNISSIDWNHETNAILTASYDKTVSIWTYQNKTWNPENLVFDARIGYLTASWNKRGDKFVAGTGNKNLIIGYFEKESNWWTGINIICHRSAVVCAKIDPSSLFVISGSVDLQVYVSSCYLPVDAPFLKEEDIALCQPFGDVLYSFNAGAWLTTVNWSISGKLCYAASHNSLIAVIDYLNNKTSVIPVNHSPVYMIIPINDTSFYAIAFDREIYLYEADKENNWTMKTCLTQANEKSDKSSNSGESNSNISSEISKGVQDALKKFQVSTANKKTSLVVTTEQNAHLHSSLISSVNLVKGMIITSDLSGFVKYQNI